MVFKVHSNPGHSDSMRNIYFSWRTAAVGSGPRAAAPLSAFRDIGKRVFQADTANPTVTAWAQTESQLFNQ